MRLADDMRRRLCRARDVLEANDRLPVAVVAKRSGFSQFHFIRLFEASFGTTPHQHRTKARLDRARRLLASGLSVTAVCMEVGFASLGSFSALFARRVGEAPVRYQRRVRALVQLRDAPVHPFEPGCMALMTAAFSQFPRSTDEGARVGSDSCASH